MSKQRKIIGYDGPSDAYVVAHGKFMPLNEPEAVVALIDSALLTGLGYSDKAAEYQKLIQRSTAARSRNIVELIWRVVCQVRVVDFSRSRLVGGGCGGLGGWRSGVLCATRGQADIRGFGVPQDHGSSWGAAV